MALRLAQAAAAAPGSDPVPPPGAAGSGGERGNGEGLGFSARRLPLTPPLRTHPPQENNKLPQHGGRRHRHSRRRPRAASWDGGGPIPPSRGGRAAAATGWLAAARAPRTPGRVIALRACAQQAPLGGAGRAGCAGVRGSARECACAAAGHVPPRGVGNAQARGGGRCRDGGMEAGPGRTGALLASGPLLRCGRPVELFPRGSAACPGVLAGSPGRQGLASLHGSRPAGLEEAAAVPLPDRGTAGSGNGRKRRNLPALPRFPGRI